MDLYTQVKLKGLETSPLLQAETLQTMSGFVVLVNGL